MKFFVYLALLAFAFAAVAAKPSASPKASESTGANAAEDVTLEGSAAVDASRFRKSAYGPSPAYHAAAHIPSPPCPNNYMFSCSPNLTPVPCAASGYGHQGAYSAPVPSYAPAYGYQHQNLESQFYQY